MSRPIVLGNGNILVGLDQFGQVRDFYFPYVGSENHVGRRDIHKIGVWVDHVFSWLSDDGWQINMEMVSETLSSKTVAHNEKLRLGLCFEDIVYNEKNLFVRKITITNKGDADREVRLFFNQQFEIGQTYYPDTAYFNPMLHALIHYKARRVLLAGGLTDKSDHFSRFATGLFNIEGKEGTWRDAEDGELSSNPIEHGSVDSTLGFDIDIASGQDRCVYYWIAAGQTFSEVEQLQNLVVRKGPDHIMKTTGDFWRAWVNKYNFTFYGLEPEVVDLFKQSLLTIRTHCDNRGGILASGDTEQFQYGRDTYAYVWPRDGVFTALAMDKTGYFDVSHRFYSFCHEVITDGGYMLHKYQQDRSLGSSWHPWFQNGKPQLAIQEDETALLLFGLWEHYRYSKNLEFVEQIYNSFIKIAADFLKSYRHSKTGLPSLSYGLWEERYGVSTFTASSVYGGLQAAGRFADLLGKKADRDVYFHEAEEIRQAIIKYLYDDQQGYFSKLVTFDNGDVKVDPTVDASSFYGAFRFGVLPVEDSRLKSAFAVTRDRLSKTIPVGGVARYEKDSYHHSSDDFSTAPGNPWFVTTLWLTQYVIASAQSEEDLSGVRDDLRWVKDHALSTGILSEQLDPLTGQQLSVAPLIWSHAEFVLTVIEYLSKLESLGVCDVCYPIKS